MISKYRILKILFLENFFFHLYNFIISKIIAYNANPKHPAHLALIETYETFAIVDYPLVLMIVLKNYQVIRKIDITAVSRSSGTKPTTLKIAALSTLLPFDKLNTLINFTFCSEYKKEYYEKYTELECKRPLRIVKYIAIFKSQEAKDSSSFAIAYVNVYGFTYIPHVNKYVGCFRNSKMELIRKRETYEECASYCSVRNYLFIVFTDVYCGCVNYPGFKTNFSYCNVPCKGLKHFFCMGENDHYYPIYIVSYTTFISYRCPNEIKSYVGPVCPPNNCESTPGPCNNETRHCDLYNGGCGKLICQSEIVNGFKFTDCFAPKGYKMDYNFTVSELDECKEGVHTCTRSQICVKNGNSFKCFEEHLLTSKIAIVIYLFIFMLIILVFTVYKILSKRKKKIVKIKEEKFEKISEQNQEVIIPSVRKAGRNIPKKRGFLN